MGRGNIKIDKSMTKTVVDGKVITSLPTVLVGNRYYPIFSVLSPEYCDDCGNKLHINSHYTRFILSSHGIIAINTLYWLCPDCKNHFHDQIIGVPGSVSSARDKIFFTASVEPLKLFIHRRLHSNIMQNVYV